MEPPSPDSQNVKFDAKPSPSLGKKKGGVVVNSRKKQRPVIVRRQNSHSSTEQVPSIATVQSSAETPPNFSEQSRNPPRSKFQENFSPSPDRSITTKSPKRRNNLRVSDSKRTSPRKTGTSREGKTAPSDEVGEDVVAAGDPGPSQLRRIENRQAEVVAPEDPTAEELEEIEVQKTLLAEANARVKIEPPTPQSPMRPTKDGFQVLHRSLRSKSDSKADEEAMGALRLLDHETKGTASLAPTLTDVKGQVNLGNVGTMDSPTSGSFPRGDKGKGRDLDDARGTDLFAKRPVQPIQPPVIPDATGSLTRSKSQLTLLLERDRARSGDHNSEDDRRGRKKR